MPILSIRDAREKFSDVLGRAHYSNERVLITRHDKPYAGVVSKDEVDFLDAAEETAKLFDMTKEELLHRINEMRENLKPIIEGPSK
jgi:prevent-host-death family protein